MTEWDMVLPVLTMTSAGFWIGCSLVALIRAMRENSAKTARIHTLGICLQAGFWIIGAFELGII